MRSFVIAGAALLNACVSIDANIEAPSDAFYSAVHDARVRDRLERIARKLRMARLLCLKAVWLADHERPNQLEASMCKALAPAVAYEAASLGMELLGAVGGRGDHLIEKLFRDVKAMDIVEGTGQIQRIVMARHLVNLPNDAQGA